MAVFEPELFEDLHRNAVTVLVSGAKRQAKGAAFEELRKRREDLVSPLVYRARDDSMDAQGLVRHCQASHARLASV